MTPHSYSGERDQHRRTHLAQHARQGSNLCLSHDRGNCTNFPHTGFVFGTKPISLHVVATCDALRQHPQTLGPAYVLARADCSALTKALATSSEQHSSATSVCGAPLAAPSNSAISSSPSCRRDTIDFWNSVGSTGSVTHSRYESDSPSQTEVGDLGCARLNAITEQPSTVIGHNELLRLVPPGAAMLEASCFAFSKCGSIPRSGAAILPAPATHGGPDQKSWTWAAAFPHASQLPGCTRARKSDHHTTSLICVAPHNSSASKITTSIPSTALTETISAFVQFIVASCEVRSCRYKNPDRARRLLCRLPLVAVFSPTSGSEYFSRPNAAGQRTRPSDCQESQGRGSEPATAGSHSKHSRHHGAHSPSSRSSSASTPNAARGYNNSNSTYVEILTDALGAGDAWHSAEKVCREQSCHSDPRLKPNEVSARGSASTRSVAVRAVKYRAGAGASHPAFFQRHCRHGNALHSSARASVLTEGFSREQVSAPSSDVSGRGETRSAMFAPALVTDRRDSRERPATFATATAAGSYADGVAPTRVKQSGKRGRSLDRRANPVTRGRPAVVVVAFKLPGAERSHVRSITVHGLNGEANIGASHSAVLPMSADPDAVDGCARIAPATIRPYVPATTSPRRKPDGRRQPQRRALRATGTSSRGGVEGHARTCDALAGYESGHRVVSIPGRDTGRTRTASPASAVKARGQRDRKEAGIKPGPRDSFPANPIARAA